MVSLVIYFLNFVFFTWFFLAFQSKSLTTFHFISVVIKIHIFSKKIFEIKNWYQYKILNIYLHKQQLYRTPSRTIEQRELNESKMYYFGVIFVHKTKTVRCIYVCMYICVYIMWHDFQYCFQYNSSFGV